MKYLIILYILGFTVMMLYDFKSIQDCERTGITKTLIWNTSLNCSVVVDK